MRSVKEWIGKSDDAPIPPRVRLRNLDAFSQQCAWCGGVITGRFETDHRIAIANGGQHRESNLQPLHLACHVAKTGADVAAKSKTAQVRKADHGLKKPKGRPMMGTKASGWKKPMYGPAVRRNVNPRWPSWEQTNSGEIEDHD